MQTVGFDMTAGRRQGDTTLQKLKGADQTSYLCIEQNSNPRDYGRRINGRSLIGVLSGHFLQGDTIKILIDNSEEMSRIKEIFNEYGTEVL